MARSRVVLPQPDGPEEADELALGDLERDVAERREVAETLGEISNFEIRHWCHPARSGAVRIFAFRPSDRRKQRCHPERSEGSTAGIDHDPAALGMTQSLSQRLTAVKQMR